MIGEKELRRLYLEENKKQKDIAEMFSVSKAYISKLMKCYGIKTRNHTDYKETLSDKLDKEKLYNLYINENKSMKSIAEQYEVAYSTVNDLISFYKIPKRSRRQGVINYKKENPSVNTDFFKNESPDLAYILGLWASDGTIYKGNYMRLNLKDLDVIEWVKNTIGLKNDIKKNVTYMNRKSFESYSINFANTEVVEIFKTYGISERKSLDIKFPNSLSTEMTPHFIRGVFDGDGSISVGKRKDKDANFQYISIVSASEDFITDLKREVETTLGITANKITKDKRGKGLYTFKIGKKQDVIKFGEWIYQNNSFGMNRKKEKFYLIKN